MTTNSIGHKQNTVYPLNTQEHVLNNSPELLQLILPYLKNTQDLLSAKEVNHHWYKNVVAIVAQKECALIQKFQATSMPRIKDQALVKKMNSAFAAFQTKTLFFQTFGDLKIALETLKKDLLVSFRHLRESSPQTLKIAQFKMPCFLNHHFLNLALFWDYVDQANAIADEQEKDRFLAAIVSGSQKIENFDLLLSAEVAHSIANRTQRFYSLQEIVRTLARNFDLQKAVQVAASWPQMRDTYFWWIANTLLRREDYDQLIALEITNSLKAIEIANSIPYEKIRHSLLQKTEKKIKQILEKV